jgi:hypothetical protein
MIEIMNMRTDKLSEPWDVKVDRSSPLGNPFNMSNESKRDEVCERYDHWFKEMLTKKPNTPYNSKKVHMAFKIAILTLQEAHKKHGKLRLFCWCAPKRCHASTIKEYLESVV